MDDGIFPRLDNETMLENLFSFFFSSNNSTIVIQAERIIQRFNNVGILAL